MNDITRFQLDIGKVLKPSGQPDEVTDGKRNIAEHVILQDQRDIERAVHDLKMAADFGITGSPAAKKRRQRHNRGRPQILCLPRFFFSDDGGGIVDGSHHRHSTADFLDYESEQFSLLLIGQQLPFGRIRQRDKAVHTASDAKIDQPLLARIIDPAVGVKAGREYGKDTAERVGPRPVARYVHFFFSSE